MLWPSPSPTTPGEEGGTSATGHALQTRAPPDRCRGLAHLSCPADSPFQAILSKIPRWLASPIHFMTNEELSEFLLTEEHQKDVITILAAHMSKQDAATQIRRRQLEDRAQSQGGRNSLDVALSYDLILHDRNDGARRERIQQTLQAARIEHNAGRPWPAALEEFIRGLREPPAEILGLADPPAADGNLSPEQLRTEAERRYSAVPLDRYPGLHYHIQGTSLPCLWHYYRGIRV